MNVMKKQMQNIRKAALQDVSRIAEILVFTKRLNYRPIFQNDLVSFGEMQELYVDSFFQNLGIGACLIRFAMQELHAKSLWVLEKNTKAIRFYQTHGFALTGEQSLEPGTTEYVVKMER